MHQDRNTLRISGDIFLRIPGIARGAIKRNILVVLLYLVMFGVLFSLYLVFGDILVGSALTTGIVSMRNKKR